MTMERKGVTPCQVLLSSFPDGKCCFGTVCSVGQGRGSWEEGCGRIYFLGNKRPRGLVWGLCLGTQAVYTEQPKQKPPDHLGLALCSEPSSACSVRPAAVGCASGPAQHLWPPRPSRQLSISSISKGCVLVSGLGALQCKGEDLQIAWSVS